MARKVFISFLGAPSRPYKEANYSYERETYRTQFAPEASLRLLCKDFHPSNDDKIFFFLTDRAREVSWKDYTFTSEEEVEAEAEKKPPNKGLHNRIQEDFDGMLAPIRIAEGKTEEEIWAIFDRIYRLLQPKDEVVFDVTNGFRTIPLLMMTLVNYAKVTLQITIRGIYYGAFEAQKDGVTPIWNLKSFSELQSWAAAANDFTHYGFPQKLIKILEGKYPTLQKTLLEVVGSIETNRGRRIMEGKIFARLNQALNDLPDLYPPPLTDLVENIKAATSQFTPSKDWRNGIVAVEWCIENKMVQQGITILEELIVTYLCLQYFPDKPKAYKESYWRGFINSCLFVKQRNKAEEDWKGAIKEHSNIEKARWIVYDLSDELCDLAADLSKLRNDINHSGYSKNQDPSEFMKGLKEIFKELRVLWG